MILVVAILISLAGMGIVNSFTQSLDPKEIERREQEKMEAEMKKQQEAQATAQKTNEANAATTAGELATFGEEKILGKPDSKTELTFAWQWTPEVQADPSRVSNAIDKALKAMPDAKIKIVNVDAKPGMQPGLYLNGEKKFEPSADGTFPAVDQMFTHLAGLASQPKP
jgi:type II secretory pathway pseudopilin PulG